MQETRIQVNNKSLLIQGRSVRIARLEYEWYDDLQDPESIITSLRHVAHPPDILTFWQRLPNVVPRYGYCMENDAIAALPIKSYSFWWQNQLDSAGRNMVRKAEKKGVVVKTTEFDDQFIEGMRSIFNETTIRQGKRFWHYGKDFHTLKSEFGRFLFREEILGAYLNQELIGFIMLAFAGDYAVLGQFISKIAHRDKAPNNILIAKAVQRCAEKGIPYLVYAKWVDGSLGDFKRHNGFEKVELPRYFVPLSMKGRIFVALRLYRGVGGAIPAPVLSWLKRLRRKIIEIRCRSKTFPLSTPVKIEWTRWGNINHFRKRRQSPKQRI